MAKNDARDRHLKALATARLSIACQTCGAGIGEPCDMPGGKRADTVHNGRYLATLPTTNDLVDQYHGLVLSPEQTGRATTDEEAGQ